MNSSSFIEIKVMNPNRFHAYLMFTRRPILHFFAEEIAYYSNPDESLLGLLLHDKIDGDFVPKEMFPNVAHLDFKDGQIISNLPEFHPYFSFTHNIVSKQS